MDERNDDLNVWVKYGTGHAVEVSVPPHTVVNDLIEAIKGKLSVLRDCYVSQIYLHGEAERKEGEGHKDGG
jgi:hypothetical protein